jgi:pyridinium-3,5-bisthiocarboxylic acid mononucleotide nickel chelatase
MKSLWIDPRFGASGDMLLGALIAAGADQAAVIAGLQQLGVDGWTIEVSAVTRGGISATRAHVVAPEQPVARRWIEIDGIIARSALSAAVSTGCRATFRRLGEVEAAQHNVDIADVHFHEVGALDAIIDIVGVWIAVELLGVNEIVVGPVGLGHGMVESAHGLLPLPAPATAALLVGAPIAPLDVAMETVTPTGAALLVALANRWGSLPGGTLHAVARGAGSRDPHAYPNVVTVMIMSSNDEGPVANSGSGHTIEPELWPRLDADSHGEPAAVIATNIDDVTPEVLGHVIAKLIASGASDVWVTPVLMKKGRPAHVVELLTSLDQADAMRSLLVRETGSLGTRTTIVTKHALERSTTSVEVRGHPISVKVGPYGAKPEYDDLVALAERLDVPLRVLADEARATLHNDS